MIWVSVMSTLHPSPSTDMAPEYHPLQPANATFSSVSLEPLPSKTTGALEAVLKPFSNPPDLTVKLSPSSTPRA